MITSEVIYNGNLRTTATHIRSGESIITDAPVDNNGKGEYFSPTDLLATSLASCMLTIIGIAANTHGFSIDNTRVEITKIMASDPRRVIEIKVDLYFPEIHYSDKEKKLIEHSAGTCPVSKSLHPDIFQNVYFHYFK